MARDENFYRNWELATGSRHADDTRPIPGAENKPAPAKKSRKKDRPAKAKKKKMGKIKKLMIMLGVAAASPIAYHGYQTQDPMETIEATADTYNTVWNSKITQTALTKGTEAASYTASKAGDMIQSFNEEAEPVAKNSAPAEQASAPRSEAPNARDNLDLQMDDSANKNAPAVKDLQL